MLDNETRKRIETLELVFGVFVIISVLVGVWFFSSLNKMNRETGEHNERLKFIEANFK